jgi:hypothetical protein
MPQQTKKKKKATKRKPAGDGTPRGQQQQQQQQEQQQQQAGGADNPTPAGAAAVGQRVVEDDWLAVEKAELAHMEAKMARDSGWLSFSLARAPWLSFSIDRAIDTALDDSYVGGSDEVVARWMHRAESSVIYWIINKIIEVEGRAELFRSLGRGWIFILLRRPQRKFKWWFEGVNRVLRNHQSDISALNLPEGGLEKYTQGCARGDSGHSQASCLQASCLLTRFQLWIECDGCLTLGCPCAATCANQRLFSL